MARLLFDDVVGWAKDAPNKVAVCEEDSTSTYRDLHRRSNQIARLLIDLGVGAGDRVAIAMPKGAGAIAAMLAAAKLGAPYVPIDPDSPAARITRILTSADPAVVIADASAITTVEASLAANPNVALGWIEGALPTWPVEPAFGAAEVDAYDGEVALGRPDITPRDTAHILFTSGSTGEPKGVIITHENVLAYVDWVVEHFCYLADDHISGHSPLHFDLSTMDIYATFAAGATLHPVPKNVNANPADLIEWIHTNQLTQWFSVPSALNHLTRVGELPQEPFASLRRLMWCGEVLPTPTLIALMTAMPHVEFTNLYGPTEATIASSWHRVEHKPDDPTASIPIGVACAGEALLVLRDDGSHADPGEIGNLYIEGVGLSPGYWKDPTKTAAVFRTDLLPNRRVYKTGDLASLDEHNVATFIGREDTQIKSRGYRIELGEIESALQTLDELTDSAIVAIELDHVDGSAIAAAYTAPEPIRPARLAKALGGLVPKYMLPHRWIQLDELPKNVNGKIDRPELRSRFLQKEVSK